MGGMLFLAHIHRFLRCAAIGLAFREATGDEMAPFWRPSQSMDRR